MCVVIGMQEDDLADFHKFIRIRDSTAYRDKVIEIAVTRVWEGHYGLFHESSYDVDVSLLRDHPIRALPDAFTTRLWYNGITKVTVDLSFTRQSDATTSSIVPHWDEQAISWSFFIAHKAPDWSWDGRLEVVQPMIAKVIAVYSELHATLGQSLAEQAASDWEGRDPDEDFPVVGGTT